MIRSFKCKYFLIIILSCTLTKVNAQKDRALIESLNEHTDEVHSVAFSPDGKQFISGSKDETLKIWDFETLHPLNSIQRHYATIYELEYSCDGKYFFSGGDKTINVWENNGTYIKSLSGHATSVWSIGSSKDAQYLVSGSFDNNFRLWDVNQGKTIHVFENNKKNILAVAYCQANNLIACGSQDGSIEIYTFDNFELIHTFSGHGGNIYSLDFSNDGKYLVSGARDHVIKIWNLESMEIIHALTNHERSVMSVKFSSNDKFLVSGAYDALIKLWDVKSGEEIYTFSGHSMPVNDVDISNDNRFIISASSDKTIKVWELKPEILIEFYFEDEYQNELNKSGLFDPKKSTESRQEYKERLIKAESYKQNLLNTYIQQINNHN